MHKDFKFEVPKEFQMDKIALRKFMQKQSDKLLGKDKMDYDQFCQAIDEITPDAMFDCYDNQPFILTRVSRKMFGRYIHEETGKPYYDIYLDIKFQDYDNNF